MEELLWPSGCLPITVSEPETSDSRSELIREIEEEFEQRWKIEVVLLPSARSALSLGLSLLGIDRSRIVYAPRWSSHCVWNVVSRYADPTVHQPHACDVILAVHQYGRSKTFSVPTSSTVIEDSCDSLIVSPASILPNQGRFEIFSLPKIMGTYTGGLLVSKDSALIAKARKLAGESTALGAHQSNLRYLKALKQSGPFDDWDALEYRNFSLDLRSLVHIRNSMPEFDRNAETIRSRLERIGRDHQDLLSETGPLTEDRLPPVLAIPAEGIPEVERAKLLMRRVDSSPFVDAPRFSVHALIPLHFGVSEERFQSLLKSCVELRGGSR